MQHISRQHRRRTQHLPHRIQWLPTQLSHFQLPTCHPVVRVYTNCRCFVELDPAEDLHRDETQSMSVSSHLTEIEGDEKGGGGRTDCSSLQGPVYCCYSRGSSVAAYPLGLEAISQNGSMRRVPLRGLREKLPCCHNRVADTHSGCVAVSPSPGRQRR